jgi:tetratricopeptide (TPR) repeat protein
VRAVGIATVLVLIAARLLPATEPRPAPSEPPTAPFAQAIDSAISRSDYAAARKLIDRALLIDPKWKDGLWKAGFILYQQDRFQDALSYLQRLTALDAGGGAGWALQGMCEFEADEYAEAEQHIGRAEKLGIPTGAMLRNYALLDSALASIELGEFGKSISVLTKLVPADNAEFRDRLIQAFGLAALQVSKGTQLTPEQGEIVREAGLARYSSTTGEVASARAAMEALLLAHPRYPMLHYAYASLLTTWHEQEQAAAQFQFELDLVPDSFASQLALAYLGLRANQPEPAMRYARAAVQQRPGSYLARLYLGRLLVQAGELEAACAELETARQLSPNNSEAHFALAQLYWKLGRPQAARNESAQLKRLRDIDAGDTPP